MMLMSGRLGGAARTWETRGQYHARLPAALRQVVLEWQKDGWQKNIPRGRFRRRFFAANFFADLS
jgi:hypothetical protein